MSIFSGETIYTVGTSATKIVDAKPNIVKQSIIQSITAESEMVEGLIANVTGGFKAAGDRFFRYGRDSFTNGLPEGYLESSGAAQGTLEAFIEAQVGEPVVITEFIYSLPVGSYWALDELVTTYGLDPTTKIISNPPFTPPTSDPVTYVESRVAQDNEIEIACKVVQGPDLEDTIEYFNIVVSGLSRTTWYYHISYYLESDTARTEIRTLVNPLDYPDNLDIQAEDSSLNTSPFYPVVPIKTNKVDTVNTSGDLATTSTKMLDIIGLSLEDVTDAINDEEANPGASDVDDAFITFAINLHATDKSSLKYLYAFFEEMGRNAVSTKESFDEWVVRSQLGAWLSEPIPATSIDIKDAEFNTTITFNYVVERVVAGVIGDVGEVVSESVIKPATGHSIGIMSISYETSDIIFRKQISETEYTELTINGLMHTTYIYKGKYVRKTIEISAELDEQGNQVDNGFYIPLHKGAFDSLGAITKVDVYYEAVILIIYAINKQKLKWYQTGAFKAILVVIAIIWTIYSMGSDGGSALGSALGVAEGTAAAYIAAIVQVAAIGYVSGIAIKALVDVLGIENTFILAVVAVVAAVVTYNAEIALSYLPSAETLLMTGTSLFQGVNEVVVDEIMDVQRELSDFLKDAAEWQEEIDEARDLLGTEEYNPLMFVRAPLVYSVNESTESYYNRTVHTGNPGVLSLDAVGSFVDNLLMLPNTPQFKR